MAIGKRRPKQQVLWVAYDQIVSNCHPFYTRLNRLLEKDGFDAWVEELCAPHFATGGRPSIAPGLYFRMLFLGSLSASRSISAIILLCSA